MDLHFKYFDVISVENGPKRPRRPFTDNKMLPEIKTYENIKARKYDYKFFFLVRAINLKISLLVDGQKEIFNLGIPFIFV